MKELDVASVACSINGCDRPRRSQGLCGAHYMRWRRNDGDPEAGRLIGHPEARFWQKVSKSETCWEWTAAKSNKGYGIFRHDGKVKKAHRFAYQMLVGPVPGDMQIDHICHNRACVNPDHLRTVTNKQNQENRPNPLPGTKSGIRGVVWDKWAQKWRVAVCHNRRRYEGGKFHDLQEAERAAIMLRNELFTHNDPDRSTAA